MIVLRAAAALLALTGLSATIEWAEGPALQIPRDHHATFLVRSAGGDFLYVAGGTNYKELYDDVVRARINSDGTLAAWEAAGTYPRKLGGTSVAVAGEYAVLTGGQIMTQPNMRGLERVPDVYTARIDAEGKLGPWKATTPMPAPRFHHPALHHNGWIYVVGGQGQKEAEAGIFAARLSGDGSVAEWVQARPLPRARSHHAAFIEGNHLYVTGGLDGAVGGHGAHFTDVIRASIAEDGTIGEWQIVSRAPHSYSTGAAFAHAGHLWMIGGVEDGNRFVDNIWTAEIRADGRIGGWTEVKPGLPVARGHVHNTPILNGRLYTAGGRLTPTNPAEPWVVNGAVHIGTFR